MMFCIEADSVTKGTPPPPRMENRGKISHFSIYDYLTPPQGRIQDLGQGGRHFFENMLCAKREISPPP